MNDSYILCVTLNPVLDATFFVDQWRDVYRTEARRVTYVAGGKGNNVARALVILGEPAHALVAAGGTIGSAVMELLEQEEFSSSAAWTLGETRLQATAVDDSGRQRALFAPPVAFGPDDAGEVRQCFLDLLPETSAVCVCGSSPGPEADTLFPKLVEMARGRGRRVLLDTSGEALRLGLAAGPDIVKANLAEAEALLGKPLATEEAQRHAVSELRRAGADWAFLTLGEAGALLDAGGGVWRAYPPPVTALNPVGSGDAMTAGILAGLVRGQGRVACLRLGMAAAAANTLSWEACRFASNDVERLLPDVRVVRLS